MVLRRIPARFFGKILKLNPIVTNRTSAKHPALPRRIVPVPLAAALAASAWCAAAVADPPRAASVYSRRPAAPEAIPAGVPGGLSAEQAAAGQTRSEEATVQAERILASALTKFGQDESFSARLRQKARIGDRVLVGAGRYVQSGIGEDQRYRFESALTCDTETFELIEVCDGIFAWTYRHYGTEAPQLERLDVRRIRDRLVELRAADPAAASPYLGGLQRSLWTARQWYRFESAAAAEIEGKAVWVVEGRWTPDSLAGVLPHLVESSRRPGGITAAELPEGVPWGVRIAIGRSDLVPYRIEWLAIPGRRPVAATAPEPIAVLELHDVQINGPIDATAFVYKPATDGLIDLTDNHVSTLHLMRP
jgi:hypothetical protein